MASSKDYVSYVLDQLSEAAEAFSRTKCLYRPQRCTKEEQQ